MSEILQEILKLVFVPTAIVAAMAWIIRELFKKSLSKDVERYKADLQRDIESHKAQLKSEFDLRAIEFQTRFSLLHQKRAEMIEQLFALLATVEMDLLYLTRWPQGSRYPTRTELNDKFKSDISAVSDFFDLKAIYFDEEIKAAVLSIIETATILREGLNYQDDSSLAPKLRTQASNISSSQIRPVMKKLETKFKSLLAADVPNISESTQSDIKPQR